MPRTGGFTVAIEIQIHTLGEGKAAAGSAAQALARARFYACFNIFFSETKQKKPPEDACPQKNPARGSKPRIRLTGS
jgi:hypothetical protein